MRKLIVLAVIGMLVFFGAQSVHADDPMTLDKTVSVHLGVDSQFGLQIWETEYDQYLPNISPGEGASGDIHVYATSNHAIPWTINASSDGLVGQTQAEPDTIPVTMSTTTATGNGTLVTDLELNSSAQPVYSAGAGDYPCAGLELTCIYGVTTQTTTKQDLYEGTVILTMTE